MTQKTLRDLGNNLVRMNSDAYNKFLCVVKKTVHGCTEPCLVSYLDGFELRHLLPLLKKLKFSAGPDKVAELKMEGLERRLWVIRLRNRPDGKTMYTNDGKQCPTRAHWWAFSREEPGVRGQHRRSGGRRWQ